MSERNAARAPKWAQELIATVKSIDERLEKVEARLATLEQAVFAIQSIPFIKSELAKQKLND